MRIQIGRVSVNSRGQEQTLKHFLPGSKMTLKISSVSKFLESITYASYLLF